MLEAVDLGTIRSTLNKLGATWPVAIPFRIPSEGRFRVELVVGRVNLKWKVKGIAPV